MKPRRSTQPRQTDKKATGAVARSRSPIQGWKVLGKSERLTVIVAFGLILWAIAQIVAYYPDSFFPRVADEAVYAFDVRVPSSILRPYQPMFTSYAPAKLGYGLPAALSVAVFGAEGPMYLSTVFWVLTMVLLWVVAQRHFGFAAAAIATAFTAFSSIAGKYVAEVGPTMEAVFGFVLLWAAMNSRRWWLAGLAIGFLAFLDFKWAVPAGLAFILAELILGTHTFGRRALRVAVVALIALAVPGFVMLIHRPYAVFLYHYVFPHGGLMQFVPSAVVIYYWAIFGALPALVVAAAGFFIPGTRAIIQQRGKPSQRALWLALIVAAAPIAVYSLLGDLKPARFFAVSFPLLAAAIGVSLVAWIRWFNGMLALADSHLRRYGMIAFPVVAILVLHGGTDGPGKHLALPAGYQQAIEEIKPLVAAGSDETITSYQWPILLYGWPVKHEVRPFIYDALWKTDRWVLLEPVGDRVTVELRQRLSNEGMSPDSLWRHQRQMVEDVADSMFSVRSDFYASDYFLSEQLAGGIPTLRRWRSYRSSDTSYLTVYRINDAKLDAFQGPGKVSPPP